MRELAVDIVSDVICPWCLIGTRRLTQALAAFPDVRASIRYHAFLLDPSTPREGVDLRERLAKKYGVDPARIFDRVEAAARESGIPLDFAKVTRTFSTLGAHTLLRHAAEKGTQAALAQALFDAYFFDGKDLGVPSVLAAVAAKHGFEVDEALGLLADDTELDATREEAAAMARQGIDGVPFFVLDQKLAFSGAQSVDTMKQVIAKALEAQTG
jgi:predicted DsbA family dithiol-disulfide isomerase